MRATLQQKEAASEALKTAFAAEQITAAELDERNAKIWETGVTEAWLRVLVSDILESALIDSMMGARIQFPRTQDFQDAQREWAACKPWPWTVVLTAVRKRKPVKTYCVLGMLAGLTSVILPAIWLGHDTGAAAIFGAIWCIAGIGAMIISALVLARHPG
jgi:hypothetical protein